MVFDENKLEYCLRHIPEENAKNIHRIYIRWARLPGGDPYPLNYDREEDRTLDRAMELVREYLEDHINECRKLSGIKHPEVMVVFKVEEEKAVREYLEGLGIPETKLPPSEKWKALMKDDRKEHS